MPDALKGAFRSLNLDPPMIFLRNAFLRGGRAGQARYADAGRAAPGVHPRGALLGKARSRHGGCPEKGAGRGMVDGGRVVKRSAVGRVMKDAFVAVREVKDAFIASPPGQRAGAPLWVCPLRVRALRARTRMARLCHQPMS